MAERRLPNVWPDSVPADEKGILTTAPAEFKGVQD